MCATHTASPHPAARSRGTTLLHSLQAPLTAPLQLLSPHSSVLHSSCVLHSSVLHSSSLHSSAEAWVREQSMLCTALSTSPTQPKPTQPHAAPLTTSAQLSLAHKLAARLSSPSPHAADREPSYDDDDGLDEDEVTLSYPKPNPDPNYDLNPYPGPNPNQEGDGPMFEDDEDEYPGRSGTTP